MASRHLVDPQLVDALATLPPIDLSPSGLPAFRSLLREDALAGAIPIPECISVEDQIVAGPEGAPKVGLRVIQPKEIEGNRPAILHIHGGGYVAGSPCNADEQNIGWARTLNCVVVSVDYRLAPETISPGAVEDCYAALDWLYTRAERLSIDKERIAIAGESAGGGLAAALALLARDRDEIPICFQLLTYPMLDDRTTADAHPYCGEFVWTAELNYLGWKALLGHEPNIDNISPYAAPARAESLVGLPPTFIAVGSLDLFFDENLNYIQRLCRSGIQVELHVYPGAYHGFSNSKYSDMFRQYQSDRLTALRRAFRLKDAR